ncbi:MAG TPA: hypothetical protein VMX13_04690 [Sedimentisphaerales bacterium]|nr:hypothetical protein [Sedimentisphaerales bacterium]
MKQARAYIYNLLDMAAILWVVGTVFWCATLFAVETRGPRRDNLFLSRQEVPPGLEWMYYYTAWPADEKLPVLEERRDIPYSFGTLILYVMRDGVLQNGWQGKVLRVKDWIPEGVHDVSCDAYLYRQPVDGGTLHICETRGMMVIAFAPGADGNLLDAPGESLKKIFGALFKLKFPDDIEKVPQKEDEKGRMYYYWHITYGDPLPIRGPGAKDEKPAFSLACVLREKVAVFHFQKRRGPGCVIDIHYPLFGETPPEFYAAQDALEKLKEFHETSAQEIPRLVELLSAMPEGPTMKQYQENPYVYRMICEAKLGPLRLIKSAIETIEGGGTKEVELIRKALKAEVYVQEPNENPVKGNLYAMKRAAIDALCRIRTDEAAMLHFEILNAVRDRDTRSSLFEGLGKYPIFRGRVEKMYEQAKAEGRRISDYEVYEKLREQILQEGNAPGDSQEKPVSVNGEQTARAAQQDPMPQRHSRGYMLFALGAVGLAVISGLLVLVLWKTR